MSAVAAPGRSGPAVRPGPAVRVDPGAAHEAAAAYLAAPSRRDPLVSAAYARLVAECDRLYGRLTSPDVPDPLRVVFTTCPLPYADASELIESVVHDRLLEVDTVAGHPDRRHPLMGCGLGGAYDRFRAVHDAIGHAGLGMGFDRDGEFAAWRWQDRLHGPLARRALAAELHGQHSVRWTTGRQAAPKAVLLDLGLVRRSVAASASAAASPSPPVPGGNVHPRHSHRRKDHHEDRRHRR